MLNRLRAIRSIFLFLWTELKEEKSRVKNLTHHPFNGRQITVTVYEWCKILGQKKSLANRDGNKKLPRAALPH